MSEDLDIPHPELASDISMGLPLPLAQEIADAKLEGPISWLGHWLFMLIMCGGFALGALLWVILNKQVIKNAIASAESLQGIAVESNFGVSLVFVLFIWIVASATISACIILTASPSVKATFYLNAREHFIGTTPRLFGLHHIAGVSANHNSGFDYIDKICKRMISVTTKIVVPSIVVSIWLACLDLNSFRIITPTANVNNPFFSNQLQSRDWKDASHVTLGCNYVARPGLYNRTPKNSIIYNIEWTDGHSYRLEPEDQINGKTWLENFETIDAEIRSGDAGFKRWVWRDRNPLHPRCLDYFRTELGPELTPRFNRLLRIGELE